ncbi:hypothetical protein [Roseovarius indicus]|uniref:hypothetical protein n=1 Tax=Roseovarius indicus TaxID=540747 RepID=UPI0010FF0FF8|nr:hypothetical protein [Roseovarius indicus]
MIEKLRSDWPTAVERGTFHLLFERHDKATNITPSPNGPPVYVEGGVPAGGYTFRPDGTALTADEYRAVCEHLSTPQTPNDSPDDRARARSERQRFGRALTPEDRRRNRLRGGAWGGEGNKYV